MNKNVDNTLTSDERHIINKCCDVDPDDFAELNDIQYTEQGNFTVCNIIGLNRRVSTGVTKRRPDDDRSKEAGYNISFVRALDKLFSDYTFYPDVLR